jgi:hypothetical protein
LRSLSQSTTFLQDIEVCVGGILQPGVQKIAIYGIKNASGQTNPTHAALQLPSGAWTSKLGPREDIEHEDHSTVDGPVYGTVVYFMSRAVYDDPYKFRRAP